MKGRRLHICYVVEQFAPPVLGGSGLVHKAWLDTLSRRHEVCAILFKQYPVDTREANDDLPTSLPRPFDPPRPAGRKDMEDARSCRAKFQRNLYTPRIIEEYHRAIVKKRMSAFLQSNQIDLLVFSKLTTVHLFG